MFESLWPRELQHIRLPCPLLSPWVFSNSYLLNRWCHPTISSSVTLFSSCPQSFPASGSFSMSQLFTSGDLSIVVSFSISPSNEYSGLISFRIDWFDLLAFQGTIKCLLQHHSLRASILCHSAFFTVQPSHSYMTTGKSIALTIWTFVDKVMSGVHETETFRDSCFAWWECVLQGCFTLLRKSNQTGFWSSV